MAEKASKNKDDGGKKSQDVQVAREARPARRAHRLPSIFEHTDFDRLFSGFFDRPWSERLPAAYTESASPAVDVIERDNEVLVRAELPGVGKDDVEVSLNDRAITIKAASRYEHTDEEGEFHRREIASGSVLRTVALPTDVNGDSAKATFDDGMLEITIPKAEEARKRRIEIS